MLCDRYGSKIIKLKVSKAIKDERFLEGNAYNDLKFGHISKHWKETCLARNILKAMDLSSGDLSLSSIEALRSIENLEPRERVFVPSKGQIQKMQTMLNKHVNIMMLLTCTSTDTGECIDFDSKHLVLVAMRKHKLEDTGKDRPMMFAIVSDGAKITNNLHQIISGFKAVNVEAIDQTISKTTYSQCVRACENFLGRDTEAICRNHVNTVSIGGMIVIVQMKMTKEEIACVPTQKHSICVTQIKYVPVENLQKRWFL